MLYFFFRQLHFARSPPSALLACPRISPSKHLQGKKKKQTRGSTIALFLGHSVSFGHETCRSPLALMFVQTNWPMIRGVGIKTDHGADVIIQKAKKYHKKKKGERRALFFSPHSRRPVRVSTTELDVLSVSPAALVIVCVGSDHFWVKMKRLPTALGSCS
ncbi:hypothetical protein BC940DRAFT_289578 [Gongronella butleri]|nr:hypothetical protein BC940DRAFT_289578 [Gongronella butleri]